MPRQLKPKQPLDAMTSRRPHLIRAHYDWILENQMTPHLLVNVKRPNVRVPKDYVEDNGTIVFNVDPIAIKNFAISQHGVSFQAQFSSSNMIAYIHVPIPAVIALYSAENHEGIQFPDADEDIDYEDEDRALKKSSRRRRKKPSTSKPPKPPTGKPDLRVIK